MEFVGEHLWVGQLGNAFVIISFIASLLAAYSYFQATRLKDEVWRSIGRASFLTHFGAVLGIISTLLFMLYNHYFEYHYVWQHSSLDMETAYILPSFWEGQEGSFILWTFWHAVLGSIILMKGGKWEAPVLTVFSLVQAFLASMILGVYILDVKIGSNPFAVLMREHPDFAGIPLFSNPDYLENLDGRGLNPLLRNYWNIIHPPTTFLGFASTLTPFAFGIAGLWTREYKAWIKPALPWTFFSVMALGTGLLMGGAWAYEALSFGGFWAWDPVENASLVPWLVVVGAGHLMLVEKNRGGVIKSLFFLTIMGFILVLYSTFLTRSGILGDASVHAFTDLGMSGQLLLYLLSFVILALVLFVSRIKEFPKLTKDEDLWSREFWIFVGSLVLFLSSFQITFSTSTPVINKVFGTDLAPPVDAIEHYNSWQTPLAILVLILIGFAQFLKYKKTNFKTFINQILTSAIVSLVLTFGIGLAIEMLNPFHLFMMFAAFFAIIANLDYWFRILKGKTKFSGASIAHAGFGILMLGALISMSGQEKISRNTSQYNVAQLDEKFNDQENILLMEGDTLRMGEYMVTYGGREKAGNKIKYLVHYFNQLPNGDLEEAFTLKPNVLKNERMGNVPEPDTRHFLTKDVYTHVTWAILEDQKNTDNYYEPLQENVRVGDTLFLKRNILVIDSIRKVPSEKHDLSGSDIAVEAVISSWDFNTQMHKLYPVFVLEDTVRTYSIPSKREDLGLNISFDYINPENGSLDLTIIEKKSDQREFIVMEAIVFPFINVLWLGCFIMVIGTFIAIRNRIRSK